MSYKRMREPSWVTLALWGSGNFCCSSLTGQARNRLSGLIAIPRWYAPGIRSPVAVLRERFPFVAGVHVKESENIAGLRTKRRQRLPVGRKRQTLDAVALLSVHKSAQLLAGFDFPQPGEVVAFLVAVT